MAETLRDRLIAMIEEVQNACNAEKDCHRASAWASVEGQLWLAVEATQKVEVRR